MSNDPLGLDIIQRNSATPEGTAFANDSSFVRGARSGTLGAGAQLQAITGLAAEAMGEDEFAKARYAGAQRLSLRAQETAPRITSYKDVDGVRDALDYAGGMVGQSLPYAAAGTAAALATGGGAIPGALAATGVLAPFEAGDIAQRQMLDADQMQRSAGDRLIDAGVGGVASAGAQAVVPSILAGKLAGRTAQTVAKQGTGKIVGRGAADVALEGVTEGAGEAIKQTAFDSTAPLDYDAIAENAVGGLAGGGVMGGVGTGAELLHSNGAQLKSFVGSATEPLANGAKSLIGRATGLKETVSEAVGPEGYDLGGKASNFVGSAKDMAAKGVDAVRAKTEGYDLGQARDSASAAVDAVTGAFDSARKSAKGLVDRIAGSEEFADAKQFAGKQGDALKEAIKIDDEGRLASVRDWAKELWESNMPPERREALKTAMGDLGNRANQAYVATAKRAKETAAAGRTAVSGFKMGVDQMVAERRATKGDVKKSEDYAGVDKVVKEVVGPFLRERAPHLLESTENINELAPALRGLIGEMSSGKPVSVDTYMSLLNVAGEHTAEMLDRVHTALKVTDPAKVETFFNEVNNLVDVQKKQGRLIDTMRDSLVDGPDSVHTDDLRASASELVKWAGTTSAQKDAGSAARQRFLDTRVKDELTKMFGKKADAVLAAVQSMVKQTESRAEKARVKYDEEGNPLGEHGGDALTEVVGGTKLAVYQKKLHLNADDDPGKAGFRPAITQSIEKAQAANPDRKVRYASAEELGMDHPLVKDMHTELVKRGLAADLGLDDAQRYADEEIGKYGAAVSEASNSHTDLTGDELEGVRLATKEHSRSPSRVDAGNHILDAVKLTRLMSERFKAKDRYSPTDELGQRYRAAHMFMEGVAAVQDYQGKAFEIPDTTVIAYVGKTPLTWGEARKLDVRSGADKASDADTQELAELRREYKAAKNALDKKDIADEAKKIVGRKQYAVNREQGQPDDNGVQQADPTGFEGELQRGLILGKVRMREIEAELAKLDTSTAKGRAREEALMEEYGRLAVQRNASAAKKASDLGTGQQEFDPFGPTFQNGRNLDASGRGEIHTDGGEAREAGVAAPSLLGPRRRPKAEPDDGPPLSAYDEEGTPSPKAVAAKKAAFLEKARSGDAALIKTLKASTDAKGLQRAAGALNEAGLKGEVLDAVNERLGELLQDEDTAYSLGTQAYSAQPVNPNAQGPRDLSGVFAHVSKVLGNSVTLDVRASIPHAGEFERLFTNHGTEDIIRISVHALNPTTVAYHESLHAFFVKLMDGRNGKIAGIVERAASSPVTVMRLRKLLDGQPEAIKQLANAEERAAYMYQFWAAGKLDVAPEPATIFGKVAEFVRKALGIWSNDERALHVLKYFHSGEFARNMNDPDAVAHALLGPGRNAAVEQFKKLAGGVAELGEKLAVAGHQRLRDTGVPALVELADAMKLQGTSEGDDFGFIPAARLEHSLRLSNLGELLHGMSNAALRAAMESMQRGNDMAPIDALTDRNERAAAVTARTKLRETLDDTHAYMVKAGVNVGDLGVGKDYFPRVWDLHYISSHQREFRNMLERYVQSGDLKGDPDKILRNLMSSEGTGLRVVDRPGMQHVKPRELAFITAEDAARFLNKNLYETMNSYLMQATRRAEWARRLDDDSGKLNDLMARAEREGATPDDLDSARKYIRSVDGTLGDDIDPTLRRLQGNVIVYQNLRLLPLAIFSSVVDPLGIAVRGGTVPEAFSAFKRGVKEVVKSFQKNPTSDDATDLAAILGVIDDASLMHTLGTSYTQGMVGERARKINDLFFRFNLMEQYNRSMRVGATEAAVNFLGRHAAGTHSAHSARWMAELGFQPNELRLGATGRPLLTQLDGLTAEQEAKVRAAINRWVDGAVLRPDAADKPIWMNDPRFAFIAHLKQFVFSFQETILKRAVHELKSGNYSPAYALASYVPVMIAADSAKGLLQGGGSEPAWKRDWTAADYVWSGVERAGLLGVGQFAVDVAKGVGRGESGLGELAGPTLEQLGDAVEVVGGRRAFDSFLLRSMPANALYAEALKGEPVEAHHPE